MDVPRRASSKQPYAALSIDASNKRPVVASPCARGPMAERVRFELTERSTRSPAFEAGAFNHSTTSPRPWIGTNRPLYLLNCSLVAR